MHAATLITWKRNLKGGTSLIFDVEEKRVRGSVKKIAGHGGGSAVGIEACPR